MECNKDEAVRARQLAEDRMEKNDFEGAKKIALKAQNLYPDLANISQLLCVCDIHCAAQKRVFGEKDWYGIFQIESLSNELNVKKQYRRLALMLHPDKNRFPGAEAAFKYVLEANSVLSDPTKKNIYDSKLKASSGSASVNLPPYHMNRNSQFNKTYGSHNHVYTPFTSFHQSQTAESRFWTSCPFCSMKYQYQRTFINTALRCQRCDKTFTAYETSVPSGVPLGTAWAAPGVQPVHVNPSMDQTRVPGQSKFTDGIHNVKGSSSNFQYQQAASRKPVQSKPGGVRVARAANVSEGLKSRRTSDNSDATNSRRTNPYNKSRRKGRKLLVESSESSIDDTSSDSDVSINENLSSHGNDSSPPVHYPRRSTRQRQKVSYHEDDDDDLPSHLKNSEGSNLSEGNGKEENILDDGGSEETRDPSEEETETAHPGESMENKAVRCDKEVKKSKERGGMPNNDTDPIEIESDSEQDPSVNDNCSDDLQHCPDPEFSDFDKNREEASFSDGQIWACYDFLDQMPRFYAEVMRVRRNPFELRIRWLEANPIDGMGLPVGCGIFKPGGTEITSQLPTFSHEVNCDGRRRGSVIIYPKQGEVWALFKDWDLGHCSEPKEHTKYKYEIVEVLSEFDQSQGISVCYLDKVEGFVCLFEKSAQSEAGSFVIRPNELYRFSHRIPSCTMKGSEGPGVPIGSFELDPASLPLNSDDLYYPSKGNAENESTEPGKSNAPPEPSVKRG